MTEPQFIDDRLSEAQHVLRDGHHDHLSDAIARVRNVLKAMEAAYREHATSHETAAVIARCMVPLISMDGR